MTGGFVGTSLRKLRQHWRFSAVAVTTLALGIGACTAIFTIAHGILLRPLPYPEPEKLVRVWQTGDDGGRMSFSDPNFEDLRDQSRSFEALAEFSSSVVSVAGGSVPVRVPGATVSAGFFEALGVGPVLGRLFAPEELHEGAEPVAVVSYGYWQRYLRGERDLSAVQLRLHRRTHSVVGVMPPGFAFPPGAEIWRPREQDPRYESRTAHNWHALGRLRDGVSLEQARAEASAVARRLKQTYGDDTWMADAAVVPLHEDLVGHVRPALVVLMGAVGFLLLVACANVANLLLARAAARGRELAVRAALGASRWQLGRPFLEETLILAIAGGALGLLLALAGVRGLLALDPGRLPRGDEIGLDWAAAGVALGLSLSTALFLGLFAAVRATRHDLQQRLTETGRSEMGGPSGLRTRNALVVAQLGITVMLLLGAGLLARSLLRLLDVAPGFGVESRVVMELSVPPPRDADERRAVGGLQSALLERVRSIPGVRRAGVVGRLPMGSGPRRGVFLKMNAGEAVEDYETFGRLMEDESRVGWAEHVAASDGYFRTMDIPLLRGRVFEPRDTADSRHVAVISESLAEEEYPGREALGQLVEFGNMDGDLRVMTVVGIVGDVRQGGLDTPVRPTIYTNARQRPPSSFAVVMDAAASPESVVAEARDAVGALAPDVPPRFRTMREVVSESFADRTFNLTIVGAFAAAALLLASIGIYGVTSYSVAQRTRELGLRMAIGARPDDVLRMVLGQGGRLVVAGLALGLVGALFLSRALAALLFEVSARDPLTFALASAPIALVALLACYAPARAATRVDPMIALRQE